jgi:CheY-like chemotaxis protein
MPRPRILVVDDSATVLQILHAALVEDYDVETAADGEEGLAKARRSPPDLIVTDSVMPALDGFGLLRRLQDDPATRAIPAIVLTSEDVGERPALPDDVRPDAVLTKSMDMSPLLDAIRRALDSRRGVPL